MSNLMAGSLDNHFRHLENNRLEVISLLINNACNLHCRHCYLRTEPQGKYLSRNEWQRVFASIFQDIQPKILSFAGKEIFFDEKSVAIFTDAIRKRNEIQPPENRRTCIGVITNGTLISNHQKSLRQISPDYFDISIDGLPATHDAIRGKGTFKKLESGLNWLTDEFSGPIWLTHTLCSENYSNLPEFIHFYQQNYNLTKYSIGFYKETSHSDRSLKIDFKNTASLIENILPQLASIPITKPVEIIFELDCMQIEMIEMLAQAGWAHPVDDIGYKPHEFANGVTLHFNTTRIPTGLWRSIRITPEGYWLAGEDLIDVHNYGKNAVANLRDHAFDCQEIYKMGLIRLNDESLERSY